MSYKSIILLYLTLVLAASCNKNGKDPVNNFDRGAMLQNYADNLIKPAYVQLQNRTNALHSSALVFNTNRTTQTLADLQNTWKAAYADWQYANAYNFGPAGEAGLRKGLVEEIGTFPSSKIEIEETIALGQWNFADFKRDTRGFLTVEYLIFGENQSPEQLVEIYEMYPQRRNYLAALTAHLNERTNEVFTVWNGTYLTEFVENDGTDVGSSTSQLYNEFVRSYESIKNFKLGLPLGKRTGQTQAEPQLVEAFYSGHTLTMLKAHVNAIEDIWLGRSRNGQDGIGFREYLDNVEGKDPIERYVVVAGHCYNV